MNPYLEKLRGLSFQKRAPSCTDKTDKTYIDGVPADDDATPREGFVSFVSAQGTPFFESWPAPYARVLATLEARCPDRIGLRDWQQAIEDGRAFLARWGEQAEALGWTSRDLFGLHPVPGHEATTYRRLSRYDETGLVWLLRGRPVVAMTESTAAIQNPTGSILTYRKHAKPALGPIGDSLDDLK